MSLYFSIPLSMPGFKGVRRESEYEKRNTGLRNLFHNACVLLTIIDLNVFSDVYMTHTP